MTVNEHVEKIAAVYRKDPRNKVSIGAEALLASVKEEAGKKLTSAQLAQCLDRFSSGESKAGDEEVYDAAMYICHKAANVCFGDGPDSEVDIDVSFLNTDSPRDLAAEVRPN